MLMSGIIQLLRTCCVIGVELLKLDVLVDQLGLVVIEMLSDSEGVALCELNSCKFCLGY